MANYANQGTNNSASTMDAAGMTDNMAGALCYFMGFITGVVFLVLAPYKSNPRIRFHAFQAIFFAAATVAASIAISIVGMFMPGFIAVVFGLASLALMAGYLGVWVLMMWKTYQGETVVLPMVGPLAQQYASRG